MMVKNIKVKNNREGGPVGGSQEGCDFGAIRSRLHRIQGQVGAIERMLVAKKDCLAILQQIVAARQALDKVAVLILQSEAKGCFSGSSMKKSGEEMNKIITALFKTV